MGVSDKPREGGVAILNNHGKEKWKFLNKSEKQIMKTIVYFFNFLSKHSIFL